MSVISLRINCIGVLDVIAYDGGKNTTAFQVS